MRLGVVIAVKAEEVFQSVLSATENFVIGLIVKPTENFLSTISQTESFSISTITPYVPTSSIVDITDIPIFILQESLSFILQENGVDKIMLESGNLDV